jgi:hypothetical protein
VGRVDETVVAPASDGMPYMTGASVSVYGGVAAGTKAHPHQQPAVPRVHRGVVAER